MLKIGRPSKYRGPPVPSKTWQELTGQTPLPSIAAQPAGGSGLDPATKVYRELYIGNTQPTMTEAAIAEFLGTTLQKVGLATAAPGNPVVLARSNGNFCFIEMRSIEDTNAMLNLNGIPFMGSTLRIGRPAKYPGPMTPAMTWPDILARLVAQGGAAALGLGGGSPAPAAHQPATRVLRLNNMLSAEDLADEEGLADIEEETKGECASFGAVKKVHIVRPSTTDANAEKTATGVGYVFVEFEEADAARKAMLSLSTRTFDGKRVEVTFWDPEKFAQGNYGDGP
ncbi:U2 small nuclear ribonucleoprotein auxiliary factor large subunit [Tribonema minus]|uniref:U2 small nuclear ribonucleoprotein auxiliary factor large subunit n=1 Tax=Tribonema minus TaxID=303371 RepID=A0A835Z9U4_9STRA|nr:U2 small nuclear ribonucleoprotein auxiliary factor large subunit [Tribonema minus]